MSWEGRGKAKFYYRVCRRPDGRLAKTYCGGGAAADAAAKHDAAARGAREAERTVVRALEAQLEPLDAMAADLDEGVDALVEASLLLAGFRRHHGQWRPHGRRPHTTSPA
jgi:hypothetical protein